MNVQRIQTYHIHQITTHKISCMARYKWIKYPHMVPKMHPACTKTTTTRISEHQAHALSSRLLLIISYESGSDANHRLCRNTQSYDVCVSVFFYIFTIFFVCPKTASTRWTGNARHTQAAALSHSGISYLFAQVCGLRSDVCEPHLVN